MLREAYTATAPAAALMGSGTVPENDGIYIGRAPCVPYAAARAAAARVALEASRGGASVDRGAALEWRMTHVGSPIAVEHTRVVAVGADAADGGARGALEAVITRPAIGAAAGADMSEPCTLVVSIDTVRFLDHPLFSREDYLASSLASLFTECVSVARVARWDSRSLAARADTPRC